MEQKRIKEFVKDIVRRAEKEGLSEGEVVCLPRMLEWEINDSLARDRQKRTFKYNEVLDTKERTEV